MKTMKKSMFITTIMMVVLLVVALSTATFAWYTSTNNASSTETKLSSATSSDANIALGWDEHATTTTVSFADSGLLEPMVPIWSTAEGAVATTVGGAGDTLSFIGAPQQRDNNGLTFKEAAGAKTPWTQKEKVADGGAEAKTTLFCVNYNTAKAANVKITANITAVTAGAPTNMVRIAVFAGGTGNEGANFLGVLGTGNYTKATVKGAEWAGKTSAEATDTTTTATELSFTIDKADDATGKAVQLFLYAWLDGATLVDSFAGSEFTFTLTFTAA